MDNILEVKDLSFAYENKKVLDNINLEINRGEFVAFIGPNGSGKSTLMKLMLGFLKPDRGQININGAPVSKFKDWIKVGYISQDVKSFNQSFPATVREIIGVNLYSRMGLLKILNKNLNKKINKALELVEMQEYKERKLGNLSGGQQQRVFIARTLVNDPEIIFLDEPLVGIDGEAQKSFFKLINKLNRDLGITIVMISHDIHVISSQACKIICFSHNKIYVHDADEFDYEIYQEDMDRENKLIAEHEHRDVN